MDLVVDVAEEGTLQRRASQVFTPQHKLEVRLQTWGLAPMTADECTAASQLVMNT